MNNYIPFLKLKSNEIMALKELDTDLQNEIIPFFDIAKKQEVLTEEEFVKNIETMKNKIINHLKYIQAFYLDNFDIDTNFTVNGDASYKYILNQFDDMPLIPVVGLDRDIGHINAVIDAKRIDMIKSSKLAIRVTNEDFINFKLVENDIDDFLGEVITLFEQIDLIFDCRYCVNLDYTNIATNIVNFVREFTFKFDTNKIIITGTSIPVPIGEAVEPNNTKDLERKEIEIYQIARSMYDFGDLYLGDYTIVGADYSDTDLPANMMQNVMTAKTVYSYHNLHYIQRGGALRTHPRGNKQFNDQSLMLVSKPFFRGKDYSFGDNFIEEKSRDIGNNVMPGTILKPTINAHMTYMLRDCIY